MPEPNAENYWSIILVKKYLFFAGVIDIYNQVKRCFSISTFEELHHDGAILKPSFLDGLV